MDYEFILKDVYVEDIKAQKNYQNNLISNIDKLNRLNRKLKKKNKQLSLKNKKLEKKNKKLSKQEKINKEILNSTSWKITAPLRKIMSLFRR